MDSHNDDVLRNTPQEPDGMRMRMDPMRAVQYGLDCFHNIYQDYVDASDRTVNQPTYKNRRVGHRPRKRLGIACEECRRAHRSCDEQDPCGPCVERGCEELCCRRKKRTQDTSMSGKKRKRNFRVKDDDVSSSDMDDNDEFHPVAKRATPTVESNSPFTETNPVVCSSEGGGALYENMDVSWRDVGYHASLSPTLSVADVNTSFIMTRRAPTPVVPDCMTTASVSSGFTTMVVKPIRLIVRPPKFSILAHSHSSSAEDAHADVDGSDPSTMTPAERHDMKDPHSVSGLPMPYNATRESLLPSSTPLFHSSSVDTSLPTNTLRTHPSVPTQWHTGCHTAYPGVMSDAQVADAAFEYDMSSPAFMPALLRDGESLWMHMVVSPYFWNIDL